ncbi:MAG: dihydrodipicolinate synthase family protein [Salinibacter sp.]
MSSPLPSGVFAAGLTPFHSDRSPHHAALARHVRRLLAHGCEGVLLFGTTGEGLSLNVGERLNALKAVLSAGLPSKRLLVGTGALALPDAVQLSQKATELGVGGILVLPPFHFRQVEAEGVFCFYDRLVRAVNDPDLRLYFYHFPELTGVPIPFSVIERLKEAYPEQIAGIKDSSGEWDHTHALCKDFPSLQVFSGTERLLLPVLEAGGAGCVSATANVTAPLAAQVVAQWRNAKSPDALQKQLTNLRTAFAPLPTIAALKHLLAAWSGTSGWTTVRAPLVELAPEQEDAVDELSERLREAIDLLDSTD